MTPAPYVLKLVQGATFEQRLRLRSDLDWSQWSLRGALYLPPPSPDTAGALVLDLAVAGCILPTDVPHEFVLQIPGALTAGFVVGHGEQFLERVGPPLRDANGDVIQIDGEDALDIQRLWEGPWTLRRRPGSAVAA